MTVEQRKKPRFAEGLTQMRNATVIRRLKEFASQPAVTSAELDAQERTFVADAGHVPGFGGTEDSTGSHTDPNQAVAPFPSQETFVRPSSRDVPRPGSIDLSLPGTRQQTSATRLPDGGGVAPSVEVTETGEVIVIFGCRGGAGSTTIAVNLGIELARNPRGCVVVDLDLQMGDVLCALQLDPVETIAEVLADIDSLDEASLRRRLTCHPSGLFALSQADRFDQLESLPPERIPALIAGLSRQFGTVLIDGLRDFSDLSISALDMADKIMMVVPEDVVAVKNASRCLEVFRRLGYPPSKLSIVVNRHDGKAKVDPGAIAATLRLEPIGVLALDHRAAQDALDEGQPLSQIAPRSPLTESLSHLAARIGASQGHVPELPKKKGFFASLRGLLGGGR
jgi:Flp pilus assembly CpaE family ATPase